VVVLALAITAGFLMAYLVASGRAVQAPGALASPTPRHTPVVTLAPGATPTPTPEPSSQPRRTPTPAPVITPTPEPIEHTIARGESLTYIAGLYCTTVDEIMALNDIANPNRIQIGQVILIPGGGCESPPPQ
jgi:LysM repeat protein